MVQPIEIAQAVHEICEAYPMRDGRSPEHTITRHGPTTSIYAAGINEAGLGDTSGYDCARAIVAAANWDYTDPTKQWPGHPSIEAVVRELRLL